jgi:hypothetical protein
VSVTGSTETPPDANDDDSGEEGRHRSEHPPKGEKPAAEFVRKLLEAGFEKFADRPEVLKQKLADLKLPREVWAALLSQLDDRKSGLYRVVAREVRDFLESTAFAEDLVRALTTLSFEIKTEIRFVPNDAGGATPKVKSKVKLKTDEREPSDPAKPTEI